MTKDNQDALRCAEKLDAGENFYGESSLWFDTKLADAAADSAAHLRRLVAENEEKESAIKIVEATCDDFANQIEAKDALLRQAVQELEWAGYRGALVAAIRQHLEGRA